MKRRKRIERQAQKYEWLTKLWALYNSPRISWVAPLVLVGGTLVVYLLTAAPVLTWGYDYAGRDGGDFISAAWFLGVPHPPGYPTYTVLAWLFTRLPLGSVAWRVQLLSACAGGGAVVLVYFIGRRLTEERSVGPVALGAATGALLLAFARLFWSHALVAEVYTLNLFFVALVLWLMLRWREGEGPLWLPALAFGVGMGNHITLAFLGPFMLLLLWNGRKQLSWRGTLLAVAAVLSGLLAYLYLPWRAATDPLINWGDPDTWEGFRWMVGAQGYRRFVFALPGEELVSRLENWGALTGVQFPFFAWPLAALGFWLLTRRDRWLALGSLIHAAISLIYSIGYGTTDWFVNLLPVFFYVALWTGLGIVSLLDAMLQLNRPGRRPSLAGSVVTIGLLLLPLYSLVRGWDKMDLTRDREAQIYAQEVFEAVEPGGLILAGSDVHTFTLWYYRYVEQMRPDVPVVNYAMMSFEWYQNTVAIHHPDVIQPEGESTRVTHDLAQSNLGRRAVYITDKETDLSGLELTPIGPMRDDRPTLWRVTSP